MVNPSLNATAVLYTDFTLGAIVSTTYLSDVIGEVSLATFESALLVAPANSKLYSNWIYVNILDTIFFVFYEYFFSNSIGLKYPNLL